MTLPNFLIIGAQKAGTTWLADILLQHPEVYIARSEIHYFDKAFNFVKGRVWYETHFTGVTNEIAIGEKTPDYLWANGKGVEGHLPSVHRNIYETLPQVKLIVSLRNPVNRAISAVNHIIRSGRVSPLHNIDDLLVGEKRHLVEGHGVIDYGYYYRQLKAYLEYFDRNQILILIFEEDIVQEPGVGLKKVCEFLDVDPQFVFRDLKQEVNSYQGSKVGLLLNHYTPLLSPLVRRIDQHLSLSRLYPSEPVISEMYKLYEEENRRLFDLIGREPPRVWQYHGQLVGVEK